MPANGLPLLLRSFGLTTMAGFASLAFCNIRPVINFGYIFALSQFFVSWGLAHYYAHVANKDFYRMTKSLIDELHL